MRRSCKALAGLAIAYLAFNGPAFSAETPHLATATDAEPCKALESADFSGILDAPTQITEAKTVAASGVVPAFCLAKG